MGSIALLAVALCSLVGPSPAASQEPQSPPLTLSGPGGQTTVVADRIQQALGPAATVSAQKAGTVVALLPGDREAAERAAWALVELFEAAPVALNGRGASTPITLACGIIAFPQFGPPLSGTVPVRQLELDPVPSAAT